MEHILMHLLLLILNIWLYIQGVFNHLFKTLQSIVGNIETIFQMSFLKKKKKC